MNKFLNLIISTILLSGCVTGYHSKNISGGWKEKKLDSNQYQVIYSGNALIDYLKNRNFALLRGAELCVDDNKNWMKIVDERTDIRRITKVPTEIETTPGSMPFSWMSKEKQQEVIDKNTTISDFPKTTVIIECSDVQQDNYFMKSKELAYEVGKMYNLEKIKEKYKDF